MAYRGGNSAPMRCQYVGRSATPAPPALAPPSTMKNTATTSVPNLPSRPWSATAASPTAAATSAKHGNSDQRWLVGNAPSDRTGGDARDERDHDRKREHDRNPAPNRRCLADRVEQRGNQVGADERREQQEADECAGAVTGGKRRDHVGREWPVQLLRRGREPAAHVDLAEEALRRHGHERVA